MADVTKISGVAIELITKIGPKAKSDITKIGPKEKPAAGPTCTQITFAYGSTGKDVCRAKETSVYFWDKTNGTLYSDSCGGTEANDGYYLSREEEGFRQYKGGSLSGVIGSCR